jgi:hypothetical protein
VQLVKRTGLVSAFTRTGLYVQSNGGAAPVPPTLVSATILSDGVTLRLLFSQPITAGTATLGLTRSVGTISSGSISGGNVDLTIPKVYAGDSVGTITYDAGTGDLAGAGGDVASFGPTAIVNNAAAWTPEAIFTGGRLGDYVDPRVASTLRRNADGTGDVSATGDIVKRINGVRAVVSASVGTDAEAARYHTAGYLYGASATSFLFDLSSMSLVSNTSELTVLLYGRRNATGTTDEVLALRVTNTLGSSPATFVDLYYSFTGTSPNFTTRCGWRRQQSTGQNSAYTRASEVWGMSGARGQGSSAQIVENAVASTTTLTSGNSAVAVNSAYLVIQQLADFGGFLIVNDQLTDDEITRYYNWVNTQS